MKLQELEIGEGETSVMKEVKRKNAKSNDDM
jgi:hypothetical protein